MSPARRQQVISLIIPIVIALCGFAASVFAAYSTTTNRITAIETKQEDDRKELHEIKAMVSKIYDKVAGW